MGILTGFIGFIVTFLMLRRKGSVGRHIGAFILGMLVSLFLFGLWVAYITAPMNGGYRNEWLAGIWAFGIAVAVVWQIVAMLIAMFSRRRAAAKAMPA